MYVCTQLLKVNNSRCIKHHHKSNSSQRKYQKQAILHLIVKIEVIVAVREF